MTRKRRFAIVLAVGVAIALGCAVGAVLRFSGLVSSSTPHQVPGHFTLTLSSGQWEIYQLAGTRTGATVGGLSVSVNNLQAASLTPSMVTVTGPGGGQVLVQNQAGNITETLQQESRIYTGVAIFQAHVAGRYAVSVDSQGSGSVIVSRPILSIAAALLPWVLGGLLGFVVLVVGLIGVIVAHRRGPTPAAG